MRSSPWCEGGVDVLDIEDDHALASLADVPWSGLRAALRDVTFCWPADAEKMPAAWEDLTRQSNLLNWHPGDSHELLRGQTAGADELCHLAVHKVIFAVLQRPEDWQSWLFAEAAASATDILVLGALLRARREAEFVPMQMEVLATCWQDAGRDEDAMTQALLGLADDPVAVWREVVALIEAHVREQRLLTDVREAAAAFAVRVAEPWGPLLLHFQTSWWVAMLRAKDRDGEAAAGLAGLRHELMTAAAPLQTLLSVSEHHTGESMQ